MRKLGAIRALPPTPPDAEVYIQNRNLLMLPGSLQNYSSRWQYLCTVCQKEQVECLCEIIFLCPFMLVHDGNVIFLWKLTCE